VESYKKIPFALSTEQVLLNILRMVDEWAEIEKRIYSPHLVFERGQGTERKSSEGETRGNGLTEKLTSEQELIYQLVDGVRTAEELIDRSLLGRFNTSEILNGLLEMGLIEVGGVQTPNLVKKVSKINLRDALGFVYYEGSCCSSSSSSSISNPASYIMFETPGSRRSNSKSRCSMPKRFSFTASKRRSRSITREGAVSGSSRCSGHGRAPRSGRTFSTEKGYPMATNAKTANIS